MKTFLLASASALLVPIAACADTPPVPPTPPVALEAEVLGESCGEDCTKHVVRTVTVEIDDDGNETHSQNVRVIRHNGAMTEEQKAELEAMIAEGSSGELTEEQQAKLETLLGEGGSGTRHVWVMNGEEGSHEGHRMHFMHNGEAAGEHGQGRRHVMMFKSDGIHEMGSGDGHVVIMMKTIGDDGENVSVNSLGDTSVENSVGDDGTRTIRITPSDGSDVTVITITKESSE